MNIRIDCGPPHPHLPLTSPSMHTTATRLENLESHDHAHDTLAKRREDAVNWLLRAITAASEAN